MFLISGTKASGLQIQTNKKKYSSRNDSVATLQASVKKIFERSVKNSRLGGAGLWGAPSPRV
ncbi:MAG: hypothetical protein IKJ98_06680 [Bacteroidales bacterium]|nr:hypothetical protein [Bacteroidales bacterium]